MGKLWKTVHDPAPYTVFRFNGARQRWSQSKWLLSLVLV
jgi:hypothetical protein